MPLLLKSNSAESGTNGAAVTASNSGNATNNNFHTVTGTWTFSNSPTLKTGLSFSTTGGVSALRWQSLGAAATAGMVTKWEVICYWRTSSIAVTSDIIRVVENASNTIWAKFEFSNSANRFRLKNNAATLNASTIAPSINTTYKFRFVGDNAAGTLTAYIYSSDGTTLLDTITNTAVAVPKMVYVDFGPNVTSGTAALFDAIEVWDNTTQTYTAPTDGDSIKINSANLGTDYPMISSAPATGILFGMWTKPYYSDQTHPITSGNHEVFICGGRYWQVENIVDNISGNTENNTGYFSSYNQNTQFFASKTSGGALTWVNDHTLYYSPTLKTEASVRDWKYVAWQVINDSANSRFIFRQWIKFGLNGSVEKTGAASESGSNYDSIVTYAQMRTTLQTRGWTAPEAAAWNPSADSMDHIWIGDNSTGGSDWQYIRYAKVFSRSTEPSLAEIESMASTRTADTTAWADWALGWSNGFPDLTDRSGNGRHLTDNGTLRQGDVFTTATVTTTSTGGPAMMGYGRSVPIQVIMMMRNRKKP